MPIRGHFLLDFEIPNKEGEIALSPAPKIRLVWIYSSEIANQKSAIAAIKFTTDRGESEIHRFAIIKGITKPPEKRFVFDVGWTAVFADQAIKGAIVISIGNYHIIDYPFRAIIDDGAKGV